MRTIDPDRNKFKHVCRYLPNISILTKSATPADVQLRFVHESVGNKSLRGSVAVFSLAGLLEVLSVVSIDINIAFAIDGDNIRLPITKVILSAAAGDLARSK